jgi:hypothetical protein
MYPRLSFQKGFSTLTQLSSSERVGRLFVISLLLQYDGLGEWLFNNRFAVDSDSSRNSRSGSAGRRRKVNKKQPTRNNKCKHPSGNRRVPRSCKQEDKHREDTYDENLSEDSDFDAVDEDEELAVGDGDNNEEDEEEDEEEVGSSVSGNELTDKEIETILEQLDLGCLIATSSLPP